MYLANTESAEEDDGKAIAITQAEWFNHSFDVTAQRSGLFQLCGTVP